MTKKRPPGEPPPDEPFGQVWPRDLERAPKVAKKVTDPQQRVATKRSGYPWRAAQAIWRRLILPLLLWLRRIVARVIEELLVLGIKAALAGAIIIVMAAGSVYALTNYDVRAAFNAIVSAISKAHGLETGSTKRPDPIPLEAQPTPKQESLVPRPKKKPPPAEKSFTEKLDELFGWKK